MQEAARERGTVYVQELACEREILAVGSAPGAREVRAGGLAGAVEKRADGAQV